MTDNYWILQATNMEAQLQQTMKRVEELERFVEAIADLIKTPDGIRVASVSTDKIDLLLDSIDKS